MNATQCKPQLIIDITKIKSNIGRMVHKFDGKSTKLRPHFKTHQCAAISNFYRDKGIKAITVSSIDMANYFAQHNWQDITVATPINLAQLDQINTLAQKISLHLLVDSMESAIKLNEALTQPCSLWIKVDSGYGRVGIKWAKESKILELAKTIDSLDMLNFTGLLTHSGHTYNCRNSEAVRQIFEEGRSRMINLAERLRQEGISTLLSMGDTPSASLAENFDGIDEMRPGNFVFYDLVQTQIGSCKVDDIAIATACPVLGKYDDELKIAIYGGSVHLSKDSLSINDQRIFGRLAFPKGNSWEVVPLEHAKVLTCCQEVSTLKVSQEIFNQISLGQTLYILPAHSCLAADIYPYYVSTEGKIFDRFSLYP